MKYVIFFLGIVLSGCNLPKDPENSYEEALQSTLLVGIALNPPYTDASNGRYEGIEVDLIANFAAREGLEIEYVEDSESELIKKLKEYEIHLIIGGFEKKTIWKKETGLSVPYDGDHVILVARGENELMYRLESCIFKYKEKHEKHS